MSAGHSKAAAEASRPDSLAPGAETLACAARAVAAVVYEGRSADDALLVAEGRPDRAAVRAITLGTLRWYLRLAPAFERLVARPVAEMPPLLRALLVAAAHQVEYSRGAPEVSCHLAVDAVRSLGLPRASGFVNAVMRRFVRERADIFAQSLRDALALRDPARAAIAATALRTAHPAWLVAQIGRDWPAQADAILDAANEQPPMTLRVDLGRRSRADYMTELAAAGRAATPVPWREGALVLEHPASVGALPGFAEGVVSVQDAGAQLAAPLLDLAPGQRVLDACAAPGGKTAHILALEPALGELVAIDVDAQRLARVEATLRRIARSARCVVLDLAAPDALRSFAPFDRILVDAPCSATGVIRRHPDIKLLRQPGDIAGFVRTQRAILANAFQVLAPGGRLLYATCSLCVDENERLVGDFLASTPAAFPLPPPAGLELPPGAIALPLGWQLLPGSGAGTDGFYYASIGRRGG